MSYDLAVFVPRGLGSDELRALIVEASGLDVDDGAAGGVTVVRGMRRRYSFTVDGPDRVEDDDVPEEVRRFVLGARYLYSILVEGSAEAEIHHAVRFARRLTDRLDGALLDQQTGQVWSRSRTRVVPRPARKSRVATADIRWYCLRRDLPSDPARAFVTAITRGLPEALPRRFGEYEPLQGKYSDVGADGFAAAWTAASTPLFTTATAPCIGGYLAAGPAAEYPDRFWSAELTFLADPIGQPGWRAALRRLFALLADTLSAFYASAEVTRGHIWSGRSLWADCQTERSISPLRARQGWLGLPPQPTWWTWFGQPYLEYTDVLPVERITRTATGVLYEATTLPAPSDDLQPLSKLLPATLFARPARNPHREQPVPLKRATEIPASLA